MEARPGKWFVLVVVAALFLGVISGAIAGGTTAYLLLRGQPTPLPPVEVTVAEEELSIIAVVQKVSPAVVTIVSQWQGGAVLGSGVIIDDRGYIATNEHVVGDYSTFKVALASGEELQATLIGTDYPFTDLALIKVKGLALPTAVLADSDDLTVGQRVIAIGSPLDFTSSVTTGVISGLDRRWKVDGICYEGLIQTDAAINPGNSGGALVNSLGEVIGINTLVVRHTAGGDVVQGISFAIPSNTVRDITTQLIEGGKVARPYLGIRHQDLEEGAIVISVSPGTPAARAGLEAADIILSMGEYAIDEEMPLLNALMRFEPGETVALTISRGGEERELWITLVQRP